MNKNRTLTLLLVIALVMVFGGSYLAGFVQTTKGRVAIERISFDTERGTLSGLLYLPKGVSAATPRPAVIVTHGYLNSAEMQDTNAIELSRRGFVVLALDMYDHGHSRLNEDQTGNFMNFWPTAMWDAAQYMYKQPYVQKDDKGNGMIGVTGHSMGGFSSSMAIDMDEKASKENGYRVIYTSLTHGSDYFWTGFLGLTTEEAVKTSGGRPLGKLAAQFDEFFFNEDPNTRGAVIKKNYVATEGGKNFLEQEAPVAGRWYDTKDGGKRIVYQPYEIHPWNHFSKASTGHTIDFYQTVFAEKNADLISIPGHNQIWLYKELSEMVALLGFLLLMIPLALLLLKLPFLRSAVTPLRPALQGTTTVGTSLGSLAATLFAIILPALLFPAIMDKKFDDYAMVSLFVAGVVFGIVGIIGLIRANDKRLRVGALAILVAGIGLSVLTRVPTFTLGRVWSAPTSNQIAYWALISVCFSLLFMGFTFLVSKEKQGATMADYGVSLSLPGIAAAFVTALLTTGIGYGLLFLVDALWVVDFRIWTFAFKTFEPTILVKTLPYLAPFFLYYLVGGAAIFVNTNTEKMTGFKGYLMAMVLNAGGIALYLLVHYGKLFATGTAAFPNQPLSSILLFALVPTLVAAAVYTRALYKRTGNVWLPAFLNALLMTIMTLANTCVYFR